MFVVRVAKIRGIIAFVDRVVSTRHAADNVDREKPCWVETIQPTKTYSSPLDRRLVDVAAGGAGGDLIGPPVGTGLVGDAIRAPAGVTSASSICSTGFGLAPLLPAAPLPCGT